MSRLKTALAATVACTIGAAALVATPALAASEPDPGIQLETPSNIVVNEIIYDEISGYSDRIELYNAGTSAADLTGWRISDDKRDRFGDVPAGTVLAPGEFAVLVTDVDFLFGLGKGDEVVLYDPSGAEVDAFAYLNTAPLAAWARCPDGTDNWAPATEATPGAANNCAPPVTPGTILINEVDSQPADWVEFYNPGTEPLDISGYEVRDNSDDHRWQFLPGTVITAGQFLVVDEATIGLVDGLQERFSAPIGIGSADSIRLYDRDGTKIDDTLPWTAHAAIGGDFAAATLARCPDGVGAFVLAHTTPGASNRCVMPSIAINEIESNGDATDWVEVVNTGSSPVDIGGFTVMDNDPAGHASQVTPVPAGTILAPGAYFVFDQPTNFVFGLGGGDTVTLRDTTGNSVDEHMYLAHASGTWARCADGTGEFIDAAVSTKGLRNACGNPVRINEVESNGGSPDDWIELVNPTATILDVSGLVVKDDDDAHAYAIPANTTIAAGGYLVIEGSELGFGLGGGDTVRVFENDALIDDTTWGAGHAAVTWGRCPDTTGPFAVTAASTKGTPNVCVGELAVGAWPGSASVRVIDQTSMFLADSSGLDTQSTPQGVFLWAVDNGTGTFWKLAVSADGSARFVDGWANGKRARFQKDALNPGAAGPDTEGITVDGAGWVYLASERDNSAKGVNQNVVLKVDPSAPGPDVIATQEWDLTALLPAVGANLGIEAVEWVADSALSGKLFDKNTNAPYDPARYAGHGDGLFFVAVEDGGGVFAFALNADGAKTLIAEIDAGLAGVMALDYDVVLGTLWAVCDDGCSGTAAQITLNGSAAPAVAHFARPAAMPNVNNEGIATAPAALANATSRPAWWFADGINPGALHAGTVPGGSSPGGPTDPTDPVDPVDPSNPGLGVTPLPGDALVDGNRGSMMAPTSATPGSSITLDVGAQHARASVEVWMYSTPSRIATGVLDAAGCIQVTIPADATIGTHRLVVYAANGDVLGWTEIRVVKPGSLATTGSEGANGALGLALMLLIFGAAALMIRRRSHAA